jgi:hypothetical protein
MAAGDGGSANAAAAWQQFTAGNPNRLYPQRELHIATSSPATGLGSLERYSQPEADVLGLLRQPCLEHVLDPETYAEGDDGVRFECKTCRAHVLMPPIPGGLVAFRVAAFMVALLGSDEPSPELLQEYLDLKVELAEDFEAFADALSLMETADKMLKGRLAA